MPVITSPHNPKLQEIRRLRRRRDRDRSGLFVAEGEDLIESARARGRKPVEGYRLAGTTFGGERFVDVEPKALASACTLHSGSRALAVFAQRYLDAPAGPLCLYLHGVRDPGNVGAALRSAAAFGASSVALGPGCADPHSPKAVRASMGAIFAVALARVAVSVQPRPRAQARQGASEIDCGSSTADLSGRTIALLPGRTIALLPGEGRPLTALGPFDGEVTLLVGAEREGLPEALAKACSEIAHIPIATDSLNAAMAATVALYEITRNCSRVPWS